MPLVRPPVTTDVPAADEQTCAARGEHHLTNCSLLRLPVELRLQIEEYVTAHLRGPDRVRWPELPGGLPLRTDYGSCLTLELMQKPEDTAYYLRTCRLLRAEMLPLYISAPGLYIYCDGEPGSNPPMNRGVAAIEYWVEHNLAERELSKDKLEAGLYFARDSKQQMTQSWEILLQPAS